MLLAGASGAWACGDEGGGGQTHGAPTGYPVGTLCEEDSTCTSGNCGSVTDADGTIGYCTQSCTSDADCVQHPEAPKCGVFDGGERGCVNDCAYGPFVCIDGLPTACSMTDGSFCERCGCPEHLRCEPGVGCEEKSSVGEPCADDFDCNTGNCSTFASVCRVPVGSACTANDCDRCLTASDGWSFCSRECTSDFVCNGTRCLGTDDTGYYCTPSCIGLNDPSCHGQCRYISNAPGQYCDCADCSVQQPLRELGEVCTSNAQCVSGTCYHFASESGYCSTECSASAECGEDLACVSVPCAAGESVTCGMKCLPLCSALQCEFPASCRTLSSAEGVTMDVCDLHRGDGASCTEDAACFSGNCTGLCAPAGPFDNGMPCILSADCKSNNCKNGTCYGNALIGDPCYGQYDCAAGSCCSNNQCGMSC